MNRVMIAFGALISGVLPLLLDSALKGAALLILAVTCVLMLPKASAATRHLVWLFAVGGLLVLPVLSALLPGWAVLPRLTTVAEKSPPSFNSDSLPPLPLNPTAVVESDLAMTSPAESATVQEIAPPMPLHLRDWLMPVWMAGFIVLLMRLVTAQWFLGRTERRCTVVRDGRLVEAKREVLRQLNIHRPVQLLLDSRQTIPMAWGVFRPRVMLPTEAMDWDDMRLRAVLLHEMAHIKRGDALVRWLGQLSCAVHWFNPLVWFAAWRLHVESERACDDVVLTNGVRASDYAKHLLHVATNLSSSRMTQACALAMAGPSQLEGRLLAVLNHHVNRHAVTRALMLATMMICLCVVIPMAMLSTASENAVPGKEVVEQRKDTEPENTRAQAANEPSSRSGILRVAAADYGRTTDTRSADSADNAGDNEINRIKLEQAESDLSRATELRGKNLIAETELAEARKQVELARAKLNGDPREVALVELHGAEAELKRVAELRKSNLVSEQQFRQAEFNLKVRQAEANGDAKQAALIQVQQAEMELDRLAELQKKNLISKADLFDAERRFDMGLLRLDYITRATSRAKTKELQKVAEEARLKAADAEQRMREAGADARVLSLGFNAARAERDKQISAARNGSERLAAYERYAREAGALEHQLATDIERGAQSPGVADIARYQRLLSELELAKAKDATSAVLSGQILIQTKVIEAPVTAQIPDDPTRIRSEGSAVLSSPIVITPAGEESEIFIGTAPRAVPKLVIDEYQRGCERLSTYEKQMQWLRKDFVEDSQIFKVMQNEIDRARKTKTQLETEYPTLKEIARPNASITMRVTPKFEGDRIAYTARVTLRDFIPSGTKDTQTVDETSSRELNFTGTAKNGEGTWFRLTEPHNGKKIAVWLMFIRQS